MLRHSCINNSKYFASYINAPPPSDLPIPKFEEKICIVTAVTDKQTKLKIVTRNPPRERGSKVIKKNRRKCKTIKKRNKKRNK